jgi:HEPN domain-containing protein
MQQQLRQLKALFDQLELREHGIKKNVSGGSELNSDFEPNAEDILQAAEDDFELNDYAGALTSAKRAISCQIDDVLECLGYPWRRKQLREKLDLIARCGFAAPRILKRVNDARNLLEHEYVHPTSETTEEALDIATLFVNATRRHFQMFMGEFYVGNDGERVDQFHFVANLFLHSTRTHASFGYLRM